MGSNELRRPQISGADFAISFGDQRAVITEVGGSLRHYQVGDRPVLHGFGADEFPVGGSAKLLLPWPNRIRDGRYGFQGEQYQLPLTETARSNAIHGLVMWVPWRPLDQSPNRVVVGYTIHPQPGYPFLVDLRASYSLDANGLSIEITARNLGEGPCPYGVGIHPYFSLGAASIDQLHLRSGAQSYLVLDDRYIPTGERKPVGPDLDFRQGRAVGSTVLDVCTADIPPDDDGVRRTQLSDPESGAAATIWMGPPFKYLVLYTGDTLPEGQRRRGVAIEPMTCPTNAFASGEDLIVIGPDESHTATWGVQPTKIS